MSEKISAVFSFFRNNLKISAGLIIAILVSGYFLTHKSSNTETLVIEPREFKSEVSLSGKVVASEAVEMGFSQSGRIGGVYAKVGDSVKKGFVIAKIENGDVAADVLQKEANLISEQAKLDLMKSGTRPEELAVSETKEKNAEKTVTQAESSLKDALISSFTKADDVVRSSLDPFFSNDSTSNPKLNFIVSNDQVQVNILNERVKIETILKDWQTSIDRVEGMEVSSEEATLDKGRLEIIRQLLDDLSLALSSAVSVSDSTLDTWHGTLSTARTSIISEISKVTSAKETLEDANNSLEVAKKELALLRAGEESATIDAEAAKVRAAEADVVAARSRLQKTLIIAPFDGIVTKIEPKVGEIISANEEVVSMIGDGTFQIESFVPEVSISSIKVGNSAEITLDAYGSATKFSAVVISIDPAETVRDGVSTYKVKLQFTNNDERIRSGMTANIIITTMKKDNTIVIPTDSIIMRDGKNFVSLKSGKNFSEKEIEIGSRGSLGEVEVISGLSSGDEILLHVNQ